MITIGIPVTKVRFLTQTLRSVADQTCGDYEVVIVDNGADGDVSACAADAGLQKAILHKNSTRIPPIANWNKVLTLATGQWFILLSDDDYFEREHLSALLEAASTHPQAGLVHSRVRLVNEKGSTLLLTSTAPEWESALDFLWHRINMLRTQFLSEFMYNTASLRNNGGFVDFPSAWCTDDATNFREALPGGVVYSSKPTLNYRVNGMNLTSTASSQSKIKAITLYVDWVEQSVASLGVKGDDLELKEQILRNLPKYEAAMCTSALASMSPPRLLQLFPGSIRGKIARRKPIRTWLKAFNQAMQRELSSGGNR